MQHSLWLLGLVTAVVYGIVIGSFLNVVIWRVPQGMSIASPVWSFCPRCEHRLSTMDLLPLFSFLALGRKCRYCKAPISWRYFTVEAITGLAFLAVYLCYSWSWASVFGCLFSALLVTIFFIDLDTFTIPDELSFLGVLLGVAYNLLAISRLLPTRQGNAPYAEVFGIHVPNSIFAAIVCALIFHGVSLAGYVYYTSKIGMPDPIGRFGRFVLGIFDDYAYLSLKFSGLSRIIPSARRFVAAREEQEEPFLPQTKEELAAELENDEEQTGMGQGDAKLAAMIGAFLFVPQALVAFLAAFMVGGLTGIGLMVFQKKAGRTAIPFGPYLVAGAMVSLLFGNRIIGWYLTYAFGQR
jgi:leader peptidase (prepilin peptidase)/N-methyltransferase